jgi:hypothetical protein
MLSKISTIMLSGVTEFEYVKFNSWLCGFQVKKKLSAFSTLSSIKCKTEALKRSVGATSAYYSLFALLKKRAIGSQVIACALCAS